MSNYREFKKRIIKTLKKVNKNLVLIHDLFQQHRNKKQQSPKKHKELPKNPKQQLNQELKIRQ